MTGYSGRSMSNNAVEAYAEGKKPCTRIMKEDILEHGINESISFFQWYVKKYCRECEWHHSSPKYNQVSFYNVAECCNKFKRADVLKLKEQYKAERKSKTKKTPNEGMYYAKVSYSISTYSGRRKYFEVYAIIRNIWTYVKNDYNNTIDKKKIDGMHFSIIEKYASKPNEMSEEEEGAILEGMKAKAGKKT